MEGNTVAVTGVTGFVASFLVKELLQRGYTVRGTVRDPDDGRKVEHLWALPGAKERLTLHKASLLEKGSFDSVVDGVDGVFHVASPVILGDVTDPEAQLIGPATEGTLNILQAADKAKTVKRVVITSSAASVMFSSKPIPPGAVVDEEWWSEPEYLREVKEWYALSKTLAEMVALNFVKDTRHFDLVIVNTGLAIGIPLQHTLDTGTAFLLGFLRGQMDSSPYNLFPIVDAGDLARIHILAMEKSEAKGRYLALERTFRSTDLGHLLHKRYPEFPRPTWSTSHTSTDSELPIIFSNEKVLKLGIKFRPIGESLDEVVASLRQRGFMEIAP